MPLRRDRMRPGGDFMYAPAGVKTDQDYPIPDRMKAWVLGDPGELSLKDKPVPVPKNAEVLVRIDAVAICATDLEIIYHGPPALIRGGMPHNKNLDRKSTRLNSSHLGISYAV